MPSGEPWPYWNNWPYDAYGGWYPPQLVCRCIGTPYETRVIPHTCPVCQGRGSVPMGFYNPNNQGTANSTAPDQCRSCAGTGVVWREEDFTADSGDAD